MLKNTKLYKIKVMTYPLSLIIHVLRAIRKFLTTLRRFTYKLSTKITTRLERAENSLKYKIIEKVEKYNEEKED